MRATRPQLGIHRRRGRHAATFNIVFREESQQFGGRGGEVEEDPARMPDGHCRRGDDQRVIIGRPTKMVSSAELHVVVLAKLGLLLGLIQIMYQNRRDSPFETHPATMAISIAALCIYGIATALLKFKASKSVEVKEDQQQKNSMGHYFLYYHRILEVLVLISSVVTPSCLVSIFVPDGLGWIVFVSSASIFSALVVAWNFLFLRIFRSANSGQCATGPNRV